ERFPEGRIEKAKAALRLPPGCRGVLIDSGTSLRAILTGQPVGDRLVEVRLGAEPSFDAWVNGEWVREALFRDFEDGLRGAPALRILREQQEAQILERKNKEVDLSGKLTVIQSRLDQCIADLQKARAAGSAPAAAP